MTPLRFSMLTATLLAFAATVHGQAPPPEPTCPCSGLASWLTPYLQQSMNTWQRVRTLATGQTCDKGVCGSIVVGTPGCCKLGSCVTGATGCVKCCETVQTPASCCCAKACACCESCKAKKDKSDSAKFDALFLTAGGVFRNSPSTAACLPPAPRMCMPPPLEAQARASYITLAPGVNCYNGLFGGIVVNEHNFDTSAAQQTDQILKIAEFYARTGHPGAAQFYHELLMRRNGPMLPMPTPVHVPYQPVQVQALPMPQMNFGFQPMPCSGPVAIALPFDCPLAPPPPPMARQVVQIHAIPAPPMCVPPPCMPTPNHYTAACGENGGGYRSAGTLTPDLNLSYCNNPIAVAQPPFGGRQPGTVIQVADCVADAPAAKHAHLVTPDLEAHSVRMTHRGDTIILEGDVILLNKKHAQPIRIEAQRAIINMKDGTITVDGPGAMSGFGVTRTSAVVPVKVESRVPENRFKAVRLRNAQANDVARLLSIQIANGTLGHAQSNDVVAQAEPISNSIILSAPAENFELLVKMVADLDKAPSKIVLPVKNMDAAQAALMLQRLLGPDRWVLGDERAALQDIRITFDDFSNSIVVEAAGGDLYLVRKVLADLDRAPQAPVRPATIVMPGR